VRDYHVLVAGPEQQSARVVQRLRERGLSAWSDRIEDVFDDPVSLSWADVVVMIDGTPDFRFATSPTSMRCGRPRVLLASAPVSAADRIRLIELYDFDFVLAWPSHMDVIAAFIERSVHRAALPARFRVEA